MGGLDLIILYFGWGFKGWKDILFGMEIGKGAFSPMLGYWQFICIKYRNEKGEL